MYGLSEWVNVWLYTYKRIMLKPSTFDSYVCYSSHITCDVPLNELRLIDIQKMINDMVLDGLKLSTIKHMLVVVRQALKKARALGMIDNLACLDGLELPKSSSRKIVGLSDEHISLLLRSAPESFYGDFYKVLLYSGMRVGELIALRWCDIDWFTGHIYIAHTDYQGALQTVKTQSGARSIPMYGELRDILERLHKRRGDPDKEERVFLGVRGRPVWYRSLLKSWNTFCKKYLNMSEPCGLHALRHTFAHSALRAGVPVKVVSAWLGHANIQITIEAYDYIDRNDFRRAAEMLSELYSPKEYSGIKLIK